MKKLSFKDKKFNIFLNDIFNLGQTLKYYQKKKKYFKILNRNEFKTEVDLVVHSNLSKIIKRFIDKPIISEEDKNFYSLPKSFWLIDPVDGTRSFINGFDGYVIQGCFINAKKIILSFIFAPKKNLFWHAIKGKGVFVNGKKIKKTKKSDVILVDNYPKPRGIAKIVFQKLPAKKYIECGSFGLKCALIVSNIANLFVKNVKFYDWDIMPAVLMLKELNYFVSDLKGNQIKLSSNLKKTKGLIVTNNKQFLKKTLKLKLYDK